VEKGLEYSTRFVNLLRILILPPFLSFSVGIEASSVLVGPSILYCIPVLHVVEGMLRYDRSNFVVSILAIRATMMSLVTSAMSSVNVSSLSFSSDSVGVGECFTLKRLFSIMLF
jgi:hypothetical protein